MLERAIADTTVPRTALLVLVSGIMIANDSSNEHRYKQNAHHKPPLPIVERAGRQKDEQSEYDNPEEEFG